MSHMLRLHLPPKMRSGLTRWTLFFAACSPFCQAQAQRSKIATEPAITSSLDKKTIAERILKLQKWKAQYAQKVASGELNPNAEFEAKLPSLEKDLAELQALVNSWQSMQASDSKRPPLEAQILTSLKEIGLYLVSADHHKVSARTLSAEQVAEMKRIENAIAALEYARGDQIKPHRLIGPSPRFTITHLPIPIVLKAQPHQKIYLSATTGGSFSNGLSVVELLADKQGIARTTWLSIGEAIGTCYLSIFNPLAGEREQMEIEVVGLKLELPAPVLQAAKKLEQGEGLPLPKNLNPPAKPSLTKPSLPTP